MTTHSSKSQASDRPEHTYVMLAQQPNDGSHPNEENSIEESHSSNPDLPPDGKSRTSLISTSKFSDLTLKLSSAFFYGICSFLITVINKIVLTSYAFPSSNILGVGQMIAIILILKVASLLRVVTIRKMSMKNKKLWTLAIIYLCNLMAGLGGTKHLPLPMFIALRRFSIAMTAIGEFYILNVRQTLSIVCTIVAMIGGSFIAAASDLTFNTKGYILVMISNFFTAANGVYIKKTIDSREINKHEILFYNALFTVLPLMFISYCTNSLDSLSKFAHWTELGFIASFLTSCVMGYLLMYSTVLCTHYNSALTTTIVGTLKVCVSLITYLTNKSSFQTINHLFTYLPITEYIDNICWDVHWWRLSIQPIEFLGLKYVSYRQPSLFISNIFR